MRAQSTLMLALLQGSMLATATQHIFHGNCRRLELITEPRLALAGWCPVGLHEAMQSEWAYNTIYLDECLTIPASNEHVPAESIKNNGAISQSLSSQ